MARIARHVGERRRPTLIEQLARQPGRVPLRDYQVHPQDDGVDLTEGLHPNALLERSTTSFLEIVERGISSVSEVQRSSFSATMGFGQPKRMPHRALCSHSRVRAIAMQTLYETLRASWSGPSGVHRRWMMITAITDLGNSVEDQPVVEVHRVKEKVRKVIADLGLHAILVLETQAAVRHPGRGLGGTLMTHVHGIAYTDDSTFNRRKAAAAACARPILSNWLGAPTVHLKPLLTKGELYRACYYLNKYPNRSSRLVRDRTKASGYRTAHQNVEVATALRLAELLSQLEYKNIAYGTGEGVKLKGTWLQALRAAQRKRAEPFDDDLKETWVRLWASRSRGRTRLPFDLRWNAKQPPSSVWDEEMSRWHESEKQSFDYSDQTNWNTR